MTETAARRLGGTVTCVGCRGVVPDIEGPIHRYMTASPGCWQTYTELLAGNLPPSAMAGLTVDAYAVSHPGIPGPQSTASVWIHLVTLCMILERRWPVERGPWLRGFCADRFAGWPWLPRPDRMGQVTAIDVARAVAGGELDRIAPLTEDWVTGAWRAWSDHHRAVQSRVDALVARMG